MSLGVARLGHDAVTAKIGEGGMGGVWQARDTKLNRDVALKVLPEAFTSDPDRLARFEREAKVLASLNHPNIGGIHGLEDSGDVRALVQASRIALAVILAGLSLWPALPSAQQPQPTLGQEGKDAPWVPTPQVLVDTMLEMAAVTPSDLLIDLGSGDGRVVISAAQLGARAIGVELDASLLALSRRNAGDAGVADRTEFIGADIFEFDFSPASVITMFLLPELTLGLRPTLFDLTPGTRIVSNTWDMRGTDDDPDVPGWDPDQTIVLDPCPGFCTAHLWTVPAKVEGVWRLDNEGGELHLEQRFQIVTGQLHAGGQTVPIEEGRLSGSIFTFQAAGNDYRAEVDGTAMSGVARRNGETRQWQSERMQH